jgi:hypothetical protein
MVKKFSVRVAWHSCDWSDEGMTKYSLLLFLICERTQIGREREKDIVVFVPN